MERVRQSAYSPIVLIQDYSRNEHSGVPPKEMSPNPRLSKPLTNAISGCVVSLTGEGGPKHVSNGGGIVDGAALSGQ